jgi:hypothetical protein
VDDVIDMCVGAVATRRDDWPVAYAVVSRIAQLEETRLHFRVAITEIESEERQCVELKECGPCQSCHSAVETDWAHTRSLAENTCFLNANLNRAVSQHKQDISSPEE